jgi:hypothetical protein
VWGAVELQLKVLPVTKQILLAYVSDQQAAKATTTYLLFRAARK